MEGRRPMPEVYWSLLLERSVQEQNVQSMLDVATRTGHLDVIGRLWAVAAPAERETLVRLVGQAELASLLNENRLTLGAEKNGYIRIFHPYSRTDQARNDLSKVFMELADDPEDTLVMLDCDHLHPPDIIERLAVHPPERGVVGALAFRRGAPHFPCFFHRDPSGVYHIITEWEKGTLLGGQMGSIVGTGAIAIKRWVFERLDSQGFHWPFFRYAYMPNGPVQPSEDIYFGEACEQCGILQYCDTSLETPHLTVGRIDSGSWELWQANHPEVKDKDFDATRLFAPALTDLQAEAAVTP